MPAYIKGGVWTNVEDELLKTAIQKYGLNEWRRVASLLPRKNAKQCKARWDEWLNPEIKKTEWSKEEDEKLLSLAKFYPSQWRTIASFIGRTASQCLERYQRLLDDADQRDSELGLKGIEASGPAADAKKLQIGDIDPAPETKPARPDAIDMDDDEKEMLSEARARLANTQGKKAKRKDRERMLAETNRLALIQKRRELKEAGIFTKLRQKKKKGVHDYNSSIPYEQKPAPGFYDTSEEKAMNEAEKRKFDKLMVQKGVFPGGPPEKKDKKRKEQTADEKEAASQQAMLARAQKLERLSESEQMAKRRKLELPAPKYEAGQLDKIVKEGRKDAELRGDEGSAMDGLIDETSDLIERKGIEGEKTVYDRIKEVEKIRHQQSALLGTGDQEHEEEEEQDIVNNRAVADLIMPAKPAELADGKSRTASIRLNFQSLPKPKNDFELVMPEEEEEEADEVIGPSPVMVEDAGERDRILAQQRKIEEEKQMKRRSQVIQRNLPRPLHPPSAKSIDDDVRLEIEKELKKLIISDSIKYPVSESTAKDRLDTLEDLDDDLRHAVEKEIEEEAAQTEMKNIPNIASSLPGLGSYSDDVADVLIKEISFYATKVGKASEKLNRVFGGYLKRQDMLTNKLKEVHVALNEEDSKLEVFSRLAEMEHIALDSRIKSLQGEVNFLADEELRCQEKYQYLQHVKAELETH
ncbi:pre-mRNA-splicing factor Cef1p [Trichomonascus vanleenenianus]|uniref:Cef1p n=1 Tax=Trichomonascus vanleenenianus TaxID=2268995 RepID=UPI003ECA460B